MKVIVALSAVVLIVRGRRSTRGCTRAREIPIAPAFVAVGALIAARRRENPIGWLYLVFGLGGCLNLAFDAYARRSGLPAANVAPLPARTLAPVLRLFVLQPAAFPRGELLSPRWRWVAWVAVVDLRGARAHRHVRVGVLAQRFRGGDPSALSRPGRPARVGNLPDGAVVNVALLVVAAASLLLRLRRARGEERQQVKWFVYTVFFVMVTFALSIVVLGHGAGVVLFPLIPISAAIAILKPPLYDIDIVIKRTLTYGALTATLGAAYLASVLLLQLLLSPSADLAIAGSTLAVAALFRPVREPHPGTSSTVASIAPTTTRSARSRRSACGCATGLARGAQRGAHGRARHDAARARLALAGAAMIRWGLVALAWAAVIARAVIVVAIGGSLADAAREVADVGLVFALCMPILGALAHNRIGWLLIAIGVPIALHSLSVTWARVALVDDPGSLPLGAFASWVSVWLWMPGWLLTLTVLPAVFPDGRFRRLARIDAVMIALTVTEVAVVAWPLRGIDFVVDSQRQSAAIQILGLVFAVGIGILTMLAVIGLVALIRRFRAARGDERRQIAWVVYGAALSVVIGFVGVVPRWAAPSRCSSRSRWSAAWRSRCSATASTTSPSSSTARSSTAR